MKNIPYTYLIGWPELDLWYYGVELKSTAHPSNLWNTYFTSSRHVASIREEHGEPSVRQIRRIFSNRKAAYRWEQKVLCRLKVSSNDKWLNKSVYSTKDFSIDPESLAKRVETRKGRGQWHTDTSRNAISKGRLSGRKPLLSPTERERRKNTLREKNLTDKIFIASNKEGRKRRWSKESEVEAQAARMRKVAADSLIERITNRQTPIARAKSKVAASNNWNKVKDSMKEGHRLYLADPERLALAQAANRRTLAIRRGWDTISTPEGSFQSIADCARHFGHDPKWVKTRIHNGTFQTILSAPFP